jgi:hypothetical protein
MQTSKTYFEQIPVETVKKIAKELPEINAIESVETHGDVTAAREHWRQLAQRVQQEEDPNRMIGLVEQLIATFDEEQARKSRLPTRDNQSRSGSSEP